MAEPVRTEPLSEMRFPEPVPAPPVLNELRPVGRDGSGTLPADPISGLLPESNVYNERGRDSALPNQAMDAINIAVDRARQTADVLRERFDDVRERLETGELQEDIRRRTEYLIERASERVRDIRERTQEYAERSPLQFIARVAIAGLAVGFVLRMWRDE